MNEGFRRATRSLHGPILVLGASGEALCAVNVRGTIDLVGTKTGDDLNFAGRGRLRGKAGPCPFCIRFSETITATYIGGEWDIDY